MINQILNIDTSSEDTWRNLGEILVAKFTLVFDFLTGFIEELDTTALAYAVSGTLIGMIEALSDSIANADWKKIAANIANFFAKIDWIGIAKTIWESFTTAFSAASDLWEGLPEWLQDIALGLASVKIASKGLESLVTVLKSMLKSNGGGFLTTFKETVTGLLEGTKSLDEVVATLVSSLKTTSSASGTMIAGIGSIVSGAVVAVINFFDMLKDGFSWLNEIFMVIGIAIAAVGAIILGAPATITGIIAAIVAAVATSAVVIKDNWESIKKWFGETCTAIGQFFSDLWSGVVTSATDAWTNIGT